MFPQHLFEHFNVLPKKKKIFIIQNLSLLTLSRERESF